jgi:hypothetical protein
VSACCACTWPRPVRGRSTLELRWEVFNLLNRANFDLPNRTFGSPNFGPDLQRQESARDAVRRAAGVLDDAYFETPPNR